MRKTLLATVLCLISYAGFSQKLISYEFNSFLTALQMSQAFPIPGGVEYGARGYSVEYESQDVNGNLDTLSGFITFPSDNTNQYPKLAYMHGTVGNRNDVPSMGSSEANLAMVLAGLGYASAAPDYPGLGTGRGFHPYVNAKAEAQSGIDLLIAMEELAIAIDYQLTEQNFITGYSQGGHGAGALQKLMEAEYTDTHEVTASAPMSGPYSISDVMLNLVLEGNAYNFPAYLPNVVQSMQVSYGGIYTELSEVFLPEYTEAIQAFYDEEKDLFDLNDELIAALIANEGGTFAVKMFQPAMIDALNTDPDHPFLVALRLNDLVNWIPQAPTRMFYCTGDDQVSYLNSTLADSLMNAAGATDTDAIEVGGDSFDHGTCFIPALLGTKAFFEQYQVIETSTKNIGGLANAIKLFPNPTNDVLNIESNLLKGNAQVIIYDGYGRKVKEQKLVDNYIDVSDLASGLIILEFIDLKGGDLIGHSKAVIK